MLNGAGSRLFRFRTHRPNTLTYYVGDGSNEPITPARFLLAELPDDIRERAAEHGETWPRREDPFAALLAAGIDEIEWRQPLCHLEDDLVSEDVFTTLREVFGEDVHSILSINIGHAANRPRRYHKVGWATGWPKLRAGAAPLDDLVVWGECDPPFEADSRAAVRALRSSPDPVELAFPSWLDRDDRIVRMRRPVVTEGLVNAWRATPISQHLQTDNSEHDIWFTESAGGFDLPRLTYRWVDAPEPDWLRT